MTLSRKNYVIPFGLLFLFCHSRWICFCYLVSDIWTDVDEEVFSKSFFQKRILCSIARSYMSFCSICSTMKFCL